MDYKTGKYVIYGTAGICKFDGTESKEFNGEMKKYCKLIPMDYKNSVYYVPSDIIEMKTRRVHTKSEVYNIIDSIPGIKPLWNTNRNERKALFDTAIKSDNYTGLIGVIKSIHQHKKECQENGSKLTLADQKACRTAEDMLHQEFAVVLGINENEVDDVIAKRIDERKDA